MAGITLAQAEAKLTLWMAANDAVASGQEYAIGSRSLKRTDAAEIREQIQFWDGKVKELSRGSTGMRIRGGTPT
ncbi:MAG: DUF6148 family protein [Bauldia sp.]